MKVTICPGKASGIVAAPPSKSMAHRALICAALSQGTSRISGLAYSEDILATLDCLRALGAVCTVDGDTVTVTGTDPFRAAPSQPLCCRESGSTLRFFIPLALLCGKTVTFTGTETLLSRPLGVYEQLCREQGSLYEHSADSLRVCGKLAGGTYALPGDVSSQFITGLLLALPLTEQDSRIQITTTAESKSYIDLTLQVLGAFGVKAHWEDSHTLFVPGNQQYTAGDMTVEGDHSAAAFFGALNCLGGTVTVQNLASDSLQGDKVFPQLMQRLCEGSPEVDLTDCPDLAPVLFALAAAKNGGRFIGTHRLKLKESDRAQAMAKELSAFGTKVTVEENAVTIEPLAFHAPRRVLWGHNDHRIVMALAVLLTLTGGQLDGAQAVGKSFPDFFEKLRQLGLSITEA